MITDSAELRLMIIMNDSILKNCFVKDGLICSDSRLDLYCNDSVVLLKNGKFNVPFGKIQYLTIADMNIVDTSTFPQKIENLLLEDLKNLEVIDLSNTIIDNNNLDNYLTFKFLNSLKNVESICGNSDSDIANIRLRFHSCEILEKIKINTHITNLCLTLCTAIKNFTQIETNHNIDYFVCESSNFNSFDGISNIKFIEKFDLNCEHIIDFKKSADIICKHIDLTRITNYKNILYLMHNTSQNINIDGTIFIGEHGSAHIEFYTIMNKFLRHFPLRIDYIMDAYLALMSAGMSPDIFYD